MATKNKKMSDKQLLIDRTQKRLKSKIKNLAKVKEEHRSIERGLEHKIRLEKFSLYSLTHK